MLRSVRESVGLGSPPAIFTTNASESINASLKRKVNYKESEWPQFCLEMQQLVKEQRDEVVRALSNRGQYRLLSQYSHYSVTASVWSKMRPAQRCEVVSKFGKATVKKQSMPATTDEHMQPGPSGLSHTVKKLGVSARESGITKISLTTLEHMWNKAEELLNGDNLITPAPGDDKTAKMVKSYSSPVPHLVTKCSSGQYKCDSKCLNWSSSQLCSHSIAVAELNSDLLSFLSWYNASSVQPNITTVAMAGLPVGRGRKGGTKRTRSRTTERKAPEVYVSRPVFQSVISSGGECSGTTAVVTASNENRSSTLSTGSSAAALTTPATLTTPRPLIQLAAPSATVQSAVVGQITMSSSFSPLGSFSSPISSSSTIQQPNTNPFYVKFLQGNIRMCQGCRSVLRLADGSIPAPPFDLIIARAERRSFRDKFGTLVTPQREQVCHYHLRLDCVKAAEPTFVAVALRVPEDVSLQLGVVHKEYLRLVFGIRFS